MTETGTELVAQKGYVALPASALPSDAEFDRMWRMAKALALSGMFKDVTQAEQAFAKILLGRDLGISATRAMQTIDLVRGNIMLRSVLLASFVRESPVYDYKILEHTADSCSIEFRRLFEGEWEVMGVSTFTIEDAKKANLVKDGSAWKTSPRNMVFSRAMSNGVKWWCSDLLAGMPVYTEGDHIPEGPEVLGSESDAAPSGAKLPDEVEAVLARAAEVGHVGLADRATAEMTVLGQDEEFVMGWVARATHDLDKAEGITDANVVSDTDSEADAITAEAMYERAKALLDEAELLREAGDIEKAEGLEDEANALQASADAIATEGHE